jgi:hypothetical protein
VPSEPRSHRQRWQVTMAPIRAPFDGEIISPKTTRHSNTIDNVKAKIDNVKAKIQDKEERRPWSRPTLARHPVFGQLAASPTSFLLEEPPRQVSDSHEKSLPHMRSLRLAREVSASHDKFPPRMTRPVPTGMWAQTHGASTATYACGGTNLHTMQIQQLVAMQEARPNKSLNASLTGCTAITSPSSPTLSHAGSTRGTQAPSTTRAA